MKITVTHTISVGDRVITKSAMQESDFEQLPSANIIPDTSTKNYIATVTSGLLQGLCEGQKTDIIIKELEKK